MTTPTPSITTPATSRLNLPLLLPLLVTTLIAVSSLWVVHPLTASRDRANKQRDIRLQYLIEAYRHLALSAQRAPDPKYFRDMESAAADIQLFGTPTQLANVSTFLDEFAKNGKASMNPLLEDLRNDLRHELQLPSAHGTVRWFRPEGGFDVPPAPVLDRPAPPSSNP
jgi:hypothetical protein